MQKITPLLRFDANAEEAVHFSRQVVPIVLGEPMTDPDPIKANRVRAPWREFQPIDRAGVVCSRCVLLTPGGETCVRTCSYVLSELFVASGLA